MAAPAPLPTQPRSVFRILTDTRDERALDGELPPGMTDFSVTRTMAFARNPLPILMDGDRTYGPVFSVRVLHAAVVFLLGPEANHYVTVVASAILRRFRLELEAGYVMSIRQAPTLSPRGGLPVVVRDRERRAARIGA